MSVRCLQLYPPVGLVPDRIVGLSAHAPHPEIVKNDCTTDLEHQIDVEEVNKRKVEMVVSVNEREVESGLLLE
jgi:hypothetical protein